MMGDGIGIWGWIPDIDDVERPADDDSPSFQSMRWDLIPIDQVRESPGGRYWKRPDSQTQPWL